MLIERSILGIDPGLAHTGWGLVQQKDSSLECRAYGCIATHSEDALHQRLGIIYEQMSAVVSRFMPRYVAVETVWFGTNTTSAFATGQARGAALAACAQYRCELAEFSPRQIKLSVVGSGTAQKLQVQYMMQQILGLDKPPAPDHAADALAAAVCFAMHSFAGLEQVVIV